MTIYIFSNVFYPAERALKTEADDVLVFLNRATSAAYYEKAPGKKILYRRANSEKDFGPEIPWCENRLVFGDGGIPSDFITRINGEYDYNYECKSARSKGATTGFYVAEYLSTVYPAENIVLVNFGYEVKNSTFRCEYHNWIFEAERLSRFQHIFTADQKSKTANGKRKVYIITPGDEAGNIANLDVVENLKLTGKYDVNVMYRGGKAVWDGNPHIDRTVQPGNADIVVHERIAQGDSRPLMTAFHRQVELAIGETFSMVKKGAIKVAYCSDEKALPLLEMSAKSVLKYNPEAEITVFSMRPLATSFRNIVVDTSGYYLRRKQTDRVTETCYLKLMIPEYFYREKVLYIDCDTLCTGSLEELWRNHIEYVGICHSHNSGLRQGKALGVKKYGLTAMLLLNCINLRKIKFAQTLMRCVQNLREPEGGWFHDETTLNAVYSDLLTFLPLKWCFCVNRDYSGYTDRITEDEAVIRHYIGGQRDKQKADFERLIR